MIDQFKLIYYYYYEFYYYYRCPQCALGCARVCMDVHGCVRVCVGMRVCVWDDFSEYLLDNRVPTSADFNTYPIRIFYFMFVTYDHKNGL